MTQKSISALVKGTLKNYEEGGFSAEAEPLPPGWRINKLGDYLNENKLMIRNGFAHGGFNQDGCGVPHLRSFNITESGLIDLSQVKYADGIAEESIYRLKRGDIIFNNTNSEIWVGKTAYFDLSGNFVLSNHMTIIRALNEECIDALWLAMKLQHLWRLGVFKAICRRHVGQASISIERLGSVKITFPPLPEQRAIAHILQTVQNAIQARRKELQLERERKAALMQHLFTYGTRREATKQTEIGEMPESWDIVQIESVFTMQLGKMLSPKAKVGKSSKPYIRNANVQWGRVDCSEIFEMDFDEREAEKYRLEYEDILVCEGGEIGRTAIWRDEHSECYFQKAIHRLRPRDGQIIPTFFLHHMERAFRYANLYGITGTQTTIAHLPQDKLSVMLIPKPSFQEQKEIAYTLDTCDSKIAALDKEITLQEELFRALLEELMTGRLSTLPLIE